MVDCGLAFPSDDMLGIDLVIPDITYLKDNIEKVKGFVITHGHEDHIGALPYVLQEINVPVYATKLTMGIIEHKLKERGMTQVHQAEGHEIRTVREPGLLSGGIYPDKPQHCRCGRVWPSLRRWEPLFIPETLKSIIRPSTVIRWT